MSRKSKRQRESWAAAPQEPFISVLRSTTKEPAWKDLSFGSRALFVLIRSFYNGQNNGKIYLSARKAADELGCSKNSVPRWFRELEDHGFIRSVRRGCLGIDGEGQASYWRLTEVGYMGEQPTKEFRQWKPQNESPYQSLSKPSQKEGQDVPKNGTGKSEVSTKVGRNGDVKRPQVSTKVGHSTVPYGVSDWEDTDAA